MLDLGSTRVSDLSPLAGLTTLTDLDLGSTRVSDLTPLVGLTTLTTLDLGGSWKGGTVLYCHFLEKQPDSDCDGEPDHSDDDDDALCQEGEAGDSIPLGGWPEAYSSGYGGDRGCVESCELIPGGLYIVDEDGQCVETNKDRDRDFGSPDDWWPVIVTDPISIAPLAGLTNLTSLDLSHTAADLTPLVGLTNLTSLNLAGMWYASGCNDWDHIARAESLSPNPCSAMALTPLAGLTKLRVLDLRFNQITDLTPLSGLRELETLHLGGFERGYIGLWMFGRVYESDLSDLTGLEGLTKLTHLALKATHKVSDLTPIAGLSKLKTLKISSGKLTDLGPLEGLTTLEELDLRYSAVTDLTPLAGLNNLTVLDLSHTPVSDITPLAGLTSLEQLGLTYARVSGFEALEALSLESLDVACMDVPGEFDWQHLTLDLEDLSPIMGKRSLKTLVVSAQYGGDWEGLETAFPNADAYEGPEMCKGG